MMPREPYEEYVLSQADAEDVGCLRIHLGAYTAADGLHFTDQYVCGLPSTGQGPPLQIHEGSDTRASAGRCVGGAKWCSQIQWAAFRRASGTSRLQ